MSVWYCGAEWQHTDWPNHNQSCKSPKGGRWVSITLQEQPPVPSIPGVHPKQMKYTSNLNKFTSDFSGRSPLTREFQRLGSGTARRLGRQGVHDQAARRGNGLWRTGIDDDSGSSPSAAFAESCVVMLGPRGGFGRYEDVLTGVRMGRATGSSAWTASRRRTRFGEDIARMRVRLRLH
ncbi:hypothetical protein C8T65DRAFT_248878 [Cerioporus squamosus]|nr:hypothetical protein C8T65DRAFT_248878 [Cerioporus squamosus]